MRVVFRVDATGQHGLGHVTRCVALADALLAMSQLDERDILFVTTTPATGVYASPYATVVVNDKVSFCFEEDDLLIVDTKATDWANDDTFLLRLRQRGPAVVRIDHPRAAAHSCDLLVIPNAHQSVATVETLRSRFGDRLRLGWDYVLMAPSRPPRLYALRRNGPVVFCSGGSDPGRALDWLFDHTHTCFPEWDKVYLVGQAYEGDMRQGVDDALRWGVVPFSPTFLRNASLVVTLFGQTVYECLWWRSPVLALAGNEENHMGCLELLDQGLLDYAGYPTGCPARLCDTVEAILADPETRSWRASQPLPLDGHGAARLAGELSDLFLA